MGNIVKSIIFNTFWAFNDWGTLNWLGFPNRLQVPSVYRLNKPSSGYDINKQGCQYSIHRGKMKFTKSKTFCEFAKPELKIKYIYICRNPLTWGTGWILVTWMKTKSWLMLICQLLSFQENLSKYLIHNAIWFYHPFYISFCMLV